MNRLALALLAVAAFLLGLAVQIPEFMQEHPARAGGVIPDPVDMLNRIVQLEAQVRILEADASLVPGRLDENDRRDNAQDERIERDHDSAQDTAARVLTHASRLDVQASRLAGHDARLDLISPFARCLLAPRSYHHVSVRNRKGKLVIVLAPITTSLGFHPGVWWLQRTDASCAKEASS